MAYLHVMLCKLSCKRSAAVRKLVNCIINGNLAVLMVKPIINIPPTLLEDLLPQENCGRGCMYEEIVLWHIYARSKGCTAIVSQMEDPGLDAQPTEASQYQTT